MFFILWRLRDHKHAAGWLFGAYCVLAGLERFVVEIFRAKDDRFFGPFTIAQMIALAFVVGGAAWMSMRAQVGPGRPATRAA
jgi:phosphatidylglycerol:prolipoprotein diacylglycerol transferase